MRASWPLLLAPWLLLAACSGPPARPLEVESRPPGAAIELDGVATGKVTPALVELVGEGEHDLRLTLPGHVPFQRRLFQLPAGEKLVAELNPELTLRVVSEPPGARVLHQGKVVLPSTPGELKLVAGAGELRMELDGHVPVEFPGFLQPGQPEWSVRMEPAAFLQVESFPAGLAIFVDRRDTELVTPAKLVVIARARHEVVVCHKEACTPAQTAPPLEIGGSGSLAFRWIEPR